MSNRSTISPSMQRLGNWMYASSLIAAVLLVASPFTIGISSLPAGIAVLVSVLIGCVILVQAEKSDNYVRKHALNLIVSYVGIIGFSAVPVIMLIKKVSYIWSNTLIPYIRYYTDFNTIYDTTDTNPISFMDIQVGLGVVIILTLLAFVLKVFLIFQAFVFFSKTDGFKL